MAFMGADTDALREAGQECQEGKEKTDEVINYLRMLIMALRAASFFTGGASAAYAEYLEGTVVPWLQRISQALGLMARVLMAGADDQDGVSDSGSEINGGNTALSYATPGGSMPSQPIGVWQGSLVPTAAAPGTTADTGSSFSSLGRLSAESPAAFASPDAGTGTGAGAGWSSSGSSTGLGGSFDESFDWAGIGSSVGSGGSWATGDHVGQFGPAALSGSSGSWEGLASADFGGGSIGSGSIGSGSIGSGSIGSPDGSALGGGGGLSGGLSGGEAGGTSGGGSAGSSGLGSSSIGGDPGSPGAGSGDSGTGLSSYENGNLAGVGGATPDSGADVGDAGLGTATADAATPDGGTSYGAVAGVAGGAAALGLGGAALAGRNGAATDKRIDELGTQNGRGSRGTAVSELQQKLTDAGYDTSGTDGVWGRNTQAAYDAYRQDHPLPIQHGSGYTSPTGFDYAKITGVQGNANVTPQFLREVEGVAQRIGAKPEHLMAVMSFETGGQFGADTPTKAHGGTAVGLIQFTPVARDQVGASREQLMGMTPTQQLAYVEKYFEPRRGPQLGSIAGLYSAVLGGTASNDLDRVQISGPGRAYEMNKGLDANGDGRITVREGATRIERALQGR